MQNLMKLVLLAVITSLSVAIAVVPAHAQSTDQIVIDVPFDFVVGTSTLTAGVYNVREEVESGILTFTSRDGQQRRFAFTIPGESTNDNHQPEVVFVRYGNESFLNKVFLSGDNECLILPRSSREKDLIHKQASGEELSLLIQPAH
jgi:hypothetical protein